MKQQNKSLSLKQFCSDDYFCSENILLSVHFDKVAISEVVQKTNQLENLPEIGASSNRTVGLNRKTD